MPLLSSPKQLVMPLITPTTQNLDPTEVITSNRRDGGSIAFLLCRLNGLQGP